MGTIVVTAITGVSVFVVGHAILRFVIEPATHVKKSLADVSSVLLFRQAQITSGSKDKEASEELKEVAAELFAVVWAVPGYLVTHRLLSLPTKANTLAACRELNSLAYATMPEDKEPSLAKDRDAALDKLHKLLGIPVRYEARRNDPR